MAVLGFVGCQITGRVGKDISVGLRGHTLVGGVGRALLKWHSFLS